jgi:hypothetical protein
VILDAKGSMVSSLIPVESESRFNRPFEKADACLKSFLFTMKNPHNIPARGFLLTVGKKDEAIIWDSEQSPDFGVN